LSELVALLRDDADVVEADLQRFYGVDLAAYWRGELSLRRLSVLVSRLPADSATARKHADVNPDWTVEAILIADLWAAWTGKPHPALPKPKSASTRYASLRARLEEQRARLEVKQ